MNLGTTDFALLRDFLAAMVEAKAKCFLVGAGARVLTFDRRWSLPGARTTLDWDFAIRAESWEDWFVLTAHLLKGAPAKFQTSSSEHRFVHVDGGTLDLVPYGGLESPIGEILWPNHTRMSVLGFRDSEAQSELVNVGAGLIVPVATLPSLALLKLHAYRDRRRRAGHKDIQDFDWFLRNYESAGNELRVHDELSEVLLGDRIEIDDAGAALLGLDVARAHADDAIAPVRELLVEAHDPWSRVLADVFAGGAVADDDQENRRRGEASKRFAAFELGLGLVATRERG